MEIQATKNEINSLTDFQRQLHHPAYKEEPLTSKFLRTYRKTTWYCSTSLPLKNTDEGESVIYSLNHTFHYLMYSFLRSQLPAIKVKSEFKDKIRISWPHNVGTNIIKHASFKEDDLDYQSFDSVWCDDYFQYYMLPGAGKRRNHNLGIGNYPLLEEWSDFLPRHPINIDQPWFYGEYTASAFPILYRNSQTRAEHRYEFRLKISDLLRMQYCVNPDASFDKQEWISVHPSKHMNKLDYGKNKKLPKPILWGRYGYVTDSELDTHKCSSEPKEIFIKDVEVCDSENPNTFNTTSVISLQCKYPCLAMFWKAQNMDALELNNHSNYTTHVDDLRLGWDPIIKNSLKYGTTYKFKNMDSDHFNISESRKHFPSAPCEAGYHAYSFAWNSANYDGEVGVVLSNMNASLVCKIADTDIHDTNNYENNMDIENQSEYDIEPNTKAKNKGPKFITRVRLLVLKKLVITNKNDSFEFSITDSR